MSEKRFEVDIDHLLLVWDTEKNKRLEIEDIVGVLNEQQKEINDLNQENADCLGDNIRSLDEFEKCTNKLKAKILQLQEENEQLKEEIRAYPINEQYAEEIMQQNQKLRIERNNLQRENEQLRLELETHKHPLWSTREAEKKVNKLADSLADEVKKNGLLNEEINQLRIENMRLKKKCGDEMSD